MTDDTRGDPVVWRDTRIAQLEAELRREQDQRRGLELEAVALGRTVETLQRWLDGADRQGAIAEMYLSRMALVRRKVQELQGLVGAAPAPYGEVVDPGKEARGRADGVAVRVHDE
jgi:hypothetical protein